MPLSERYISIKISESRIKERNKQLSLLLDLSDSVLSSHDLKKVFKMAMSKVVKYFDFEGARIYLLDDSGELLTLTAHLGVNIKGMETFKISEDFSGKAVRTKSIIAQHSADLEDKERSRLLLEKGLDCVICVPLIVMNKIIGVMNLASSKLVTLNDDDIDLLIAIGNLVAVAVNNSMLYHDIESKMEEIKTKKDTIEFFAYTASHDLKGPIIAVQGLAKLLQKRYSDSLDEKGQESLKHILKSSDHIAKLIDDINAYIRAKESPLDIEPIEINEITETVRNEFAEFLDSRKITWSQPENLPYINADRLSLIRVFQNLVDNSLKYGGDQLSEIKIGYEDTENFHIFYVSDNGVGIKKEDQGKVFKLFQRSISSRGIEGTGLGLTIIKEIVFRHRGKVWMEPRYGNETTFYFSISKNL